MFLVTTEFWNVCKIFGWYLLNENCMYIHSAISHEEDFTHEFNKATSQTDCFEYIYEIKYI